MITPKVFATMLATALSVFAVTAIAEAQPATNANPAQRPQGPCDIYAAAGDPCVAAHSTTRALYASYNGPLYQVLRQSDQKTLNIGVVQPHGTDTGGYADAAAQDAFCANTFCWITILYDQSPKHNDLTQPPRGGFSGPAMGGFDNLPIADMAPITIMGHKAYGVFIEPGMGLRLDDAKGTAVDDQAEGQYWVINGHHFNSGCCFDYGNAETDSRDDGNGTMETAYYGDASGWYHGPPPGPWVMTDQENNLVGCVNADGSKACTTLPSVNWRFVTAMAKGESHHWTSLGGDAQTSALSVMFSGPRVNSTYDPMRKQGAILLGNGGDNSNSSQGTFYEGAMTAANTFPTDATDQLVQANIAAARYDVQRLMLAPSASLAAPSGIQTFSPGSSQGSTVTFTNTTGNPVADVNLDVTAPRGWTIHASGGASFAGPVPPGASVTAKFDVTSGPTPFNGDLIANASWTNLRTRSKSSETTVEKIRNVDPIRINEFSTQASGSFIELYNAGTATVDLSGWTLTEHPTQQAIFSAMSIPSGTRLAGHGFYLFGLSNSGLAAPAHAGDTTVHIRSTTGMKVGDTVEVGFGPDAETRKIAGIGTPASAATTLWQPLPDGLVISVPVGSTNIPVSSVSGFSVGEKIGIGHGGAYPTVASSMEQYELATVTEVGRPGTQAYLAADAAAGATNLKVTSVANISPGDKIRLDIDSVGHGIEAVTITRVGTPASRLSLTANAAEGATRIMVRNTSGFAVGATIIVGKPSSREKVVITAVDAQALEFAPALTNAHATGDEVVNPGTGLDLSTPLRFNHAANMPFSDRGTGISFAPATAFTHQSNEPVQALGTGVTLDAALTRDHAIDSVIRDSSVTNVGYQGNPTPNQWFGGPALSPAAGSMVLRNPAGLVVDSLNYGLLVDPWVAEGYQAASGPGESGCRVTNPGIPGSPRSESSETTTFYKSVGRFPDGADTGSNCNDFFTQAAAVVSVDAAAGSNNFKVSSVEGFIAGQKIMIDVGPNQETAVIANVGTPGGTIVGTSIATGATTIPVASALGFTPGQSITVGSGTSSETATIAAVGRRGSSPITVAQPLTHAHASGDSVSGSGITLVAPLGRAHASGSPVSDHLPTPGAPNLYSPRF